MKIVDDEPVPGSRPESSSGHTTGWTAGFATLLFGLSIAAGLPPAAMLAPLSPALPVVRSEPDPILSAAELELLLGQPTTEVGRGQVALGELDQRMQRLIVSLDIFRVDYRSGVLVSLGIIRPDRMARGAAGVTIADLWALAREMLPRQGFVCDRQEGVGDDALLVRYGGVTTQVIWLAGDRLATASLTSLEAEEEWMVEAVRSVAADLDRHLR